MYWPITGLGADVASAGEMATAIEAGFPPHRMFVAGPWKLPETIALLEQVPEAVVSIDSASELEFFARQKLQNRAVLRLRPDFDSNAVVAAGADCRFGIPEHQLKRCQEIIAATRVDVIGFHVFAGSQVLRAEDVTEHLTGALEVSLRAAEALGITPKLLNLGGGFGTPYGLEDRELDLEPIGRQLRSLVQRAAPAEDRAGTRPLPRCAGGLVLDVSPWASDPWRKTCRRRRRGHAPAGRLVWALFAPQGGPAAGGHRLRRPRTIHRRAGLPELARRRHGRSDFLACAGGRQRISLRQRGRLRPVGIAGTVSWQSTTGRSRVRRPLRASDARQRHGTRRTCRPTSRHSRATNDIMMARTTQIGCALSALLCLPHAGIAQGPKQITNSIGMKFVQIPAGKFLMGSPESEGEREAQELQHEVTITRPFYLGVYEVSQREFSEVMGVSKRWAPFFDSKHGGGPDHPVEFMTWKKTHEFLANLSKLGDEQAAGRTYRLPTEAEWGIRLPRRRDDGFCVW